MMVWNVRCKCGWRGKFQSFELPTECSNCGNEWYRIVSVEGADAQIPEEF